MSSIYRTNAFGPALPPRLQTGGAALFANGTGTASFDHFRWTEYPDPSLNLSAVGRAGSSYIQWNANLPTNTTLGMDVSTDGVTWTDMSGQNGGTITPINGEPDPTVDLFAVDSSTTYTSSNQTGGASATWTYDTANSRLVATGGTNAIFYNNNIAQTEMDLLCDLDQSDAGGLVFCFVDQSDFYALVVGDDHASVGTPNRLTLYKVASNVQTQLAQATISFVRGTFHRIRATNLSGVITCYVDGTTEITYTDASPLGAGNVGLWQNGGTTGARFYQFWIQPKGDNLNQTWPTYLYTRQRLGTSDTTVTPQVLDMTVTVHSGTIDPGVVIPSADYRQTVVSKNLDDLAKQSNYAWWIDQNKVMYFQHRVALPAPWILYSTKQGISVDLEVDSNLQVEVNNDLYRNRQVLTNVINSGSFTDTFKGDGKTTSFTLRYPVTVGTVPVVTLDNAGQTLLKKGVTGAQWYYAEGDATIAQDSSGTVLGTGDTLSVSYTGTYLTNVTVDNTAAQTALAVVEGGSGIVEIVEDVSQKNMQYAAALVYGQQLLTRYGVAGRTITFGTVRSGLQVGQILACFIPEENVWNMQALIVTIDVTLETAQVNGVTSNLYYYLVTASELPNKGSWEKLLASSILLPTEVG